MSPWAGCFAVRRAPDSSLAHSGTGRGRVRVLEVDRPSTPDRIGTGDGRLVRRREADQLVLGLRHRASATGPEVSSSGSGHSRREVRDVVGVTVTFDTVP